MSKQQELPLERQRELDEWLEHCREPPWPFATRFVTVAECEYLDQRRRGALLPVAAREKR
jgi:hypothetical protein